MVDAAVTGHAAQARSLNRQHSAGRVQFGKHLLPIRQVNRLDEVAIAAGLARSLPVIFLAPPGQCDNHDVAAPGLLTDAPRGVQPAHPRHAEVHQDQLRSELFCQLHGFTAIVSRPHVVAQKPQRQGKTIRPVAIIVHHEDAAGRPPPIVLSRSQRSGRPCQYGQRGGEDAALALGVLPAELEAATEPASAEVAPGLAEKRATADRNGTHLPAEGEPHSASSIAGDAARTNEAAVCPSSASQLNYVRRLASKIGRAAALRVEVLAQRSYGKPLGELSQDEASRLIATLRAVKAGKLDRETLLEEAAA